MSVLLHTVEEQIRDLPVESQREIARETLKRLYNGSLFATARSLLEYKDMTLRTHGDMVNVLESDIPNKLIVMPRGTFKSSVSTVAYPIWLLNRNPNLRILIDSEVYTNSKNFLREIKAQLLREELTSLFGNYMTDTNWTEGEITIAQRTEHRKEASITCGGIGTVKVGQHYDVIISDDLNSMNNSETQEGLRKVITHYRMNRALLEPNGIYAIIGTRYSAGDLIQHVLDNELVLDSKGLIGG